MLKFIWPPLQSKKLTPTPTPTHPVRRWEIIAWLWYIVFSGPFAVQITFLWIWKVSASWGEGRVRTTGHLTTLGPGTCSWRWLRGPLQPLFGLPYSWEPRRNWKKSRPGIREIRAGHCLESGHGLLQHESTTHFFKILSQLLFFLVSLPFSPLLFDAADLMSGL